MNFKKNIILIPLFFIFTSLLFATNKYDIKLHVDDPEERYRVFIELYVSDEHEVERANFIYPDYECEGVDLKSGWTEKDKLIDIKEKITKGRCDSTFYFFYFNDDGEKISLVKIKNGRKYISTKITSMEINRNIREEQEEQDTIVYYKNGKMKSKTTYLNNGDFDKMIECFYEDGSKKNIVKFRLDKAIKGTKYNRDGSSKKMSEADFSNLGYDFALNKTTNKNGSIQNLND